MTTNVAALNISVSANTATLQTDFARAAEIARRGGNDMKASMLDAANSAQHGFGSLASSMGLLNNPIARSVAGLGSIGLAIGALAGGAYVFKELVAGAIEMGEKMADMSIKTGLSVESISKFTLVARLSGTEMDTVAMLMKKLSISATEATTGNEKLLRVFNSIGISTRELKSLSPDDLMVRFATAIQGLDPMVLQDVMKQLGGRGGSEALVFLRELAQRVDELHPKLTTQFAADAKEFNDSLKSMTENVGYLGVSFASKLLPQLNLVIDAYNRARIAGAGVFSAIGDSISTQNTVNSMASEGKFISDYKTVIPQVTEELKTASGKRLADLQSMLKVLEDFQKKQVTSLNAPLDPTKNAAVVKAIGINNNPNPEGDNFIKGLNNLITKTDQGKYAMLELEAAEKKVSAAAAPLIAALQKADEARSVKLYENALERQSNDIAFQITLVGRSTREVELLNVEHKNTLELQKQIEAIEKQSGVLSASARAQMTADTKAANDYQIVAIKKRQDAERSWGFGSTETLRKYVDDNENAADQARRFWDNGITGMGDAMANFCLTGKLDFSSLASSIISDIIRIKTEAMIAQSVSGMSGFSFSSLFGGGSTGTGLTGGAGASGGMTFPSGGTWGALSANGNAFIGGNVIPFAKGGVVSSPTMFPMAGGSSGLMGENGAEAVMPLSRDSSGKLGIKALSSSTNGNIINITVNNEAGGDGYVAVASAKKNDTGMNIELLVRKAMATDIRNNGQISQQMSNAFGLKRAS
jgi:lambda family phage tail tape measure protein